MTKMSNEIERIENLRRYVSMLNKDLDFLDRVSRDRLLHVHSAASGLRHRRFPRRGRLPVNTGIGHLELRAASPAASAQF